MDEDESRHARAGGVIILVFGLIVAGIFGGWPLWEAHRGAARVSWFPVLFGGGIGIAMLGLVLIVGGPPVWARFARQGKEKRKGPFFWLLVAIIVVPGIAAHFWLESQIAAMGYVRH